MACLSDDMVSSTTPKYPRAVIRHFARNPEAPMSNWARLNSWTVSLHPSTYFSTGNAFVISPQDYVIAVICDVPDDRHVVGDCTLLKGAFDVAPHTVCLLLKNKSQVVNVGVPRKCDLYTLSSNRLIEANLSTIKIDDFYNLYRD